MDTPQKTAAPKLRADAEANRMRIIDAATKLFASEGLDVTLDDVAREAGVGVGTVYRRFANKDALIDGVFVDKFRAVAQRACASKDLRDPLGPLESLVDLMAFACEEFAGDRGLRALAMRETEPSESVREAKSELEAAIAEVVVRAQSAGVLRPGLASSDFTLAFVMVTSIADLTEETAPGTWRRAACFVVDGLRADGVKSALTTPALTDAELEEVHLHKHERLRRC